MSIYDVKKMQPRNGHTLVVLVVARISGCQSQKDSSLLREMMIRELTVDVFDTPNREKIRGRVIDLVNQGLNCDTILSTLPKKTSAKVIGAAIRLDDRINANSIADPYELQLAPPSDSKKLRRHRNPRFSFSTRENYKRPSL